MENRPPNRPERGGSENRATKDQGTPDSLQHATPDAGRKVDNSHAELWRRTPLTSNATGPRNMLAALGYYGIGRWAMPFAH